MPKNFATKNFLPSGQVKVFHWKEEIRMSWLLEKKSHLTPKVSGELRVLSYQQLMREMETKQKVFLKKITP